MILMDEEEVYDLAFGGAKITASAFRVLAALAIIAGVLSAIALYAENEVGWAIYGGFSGCLLAAVLSALGWIVDLLRGILAAVWRIDDDEDID